MFGDNTPSAGAKGAEAAERDRLIVVQAPVLALDDTRHDCTREYGNWVSRQVYVHGTDTNSRCHSQKFAGRLPTRYMYSLGTPACSRILQYRGTLIVPRVQVEVPVLTAVPSLESIVFEHVQVQ